MERQRWWRVTAWGSGFGANGGLCNSPEQADAAVVHLIENVGWSSEDVNVEELDLTEEEWEEIAKKNRSTPGVVHKPFGGTYRLEPHRPLKDLHLTRGSGPDVTFHPNFTY